MGGASLLSHRVKFLQRINAIALLVEVILEKHNCPQQKDTRTTADETVIFRVQLCSYILHVYISLRFGCSGLAMVQVGL